MGNDEIFLVHFSTPLNRYDEEFFLIQKQQKIENRSIFLSGIIIMNIVNFCKIIVEEIWEQLVIEFKHEIRNFHIYHVV